MTTHALATAAIPFRSDRADRVNTCLAGFGNPAANEVKTKLDQTGVIHFVSLSVVETSEPKSFILIDLSADADDDDVALETLAGAMAAEFAAILRAASLFPPPDLGKWLRSHRLRLGPALWATSGLAFDGSPGMSVKRIIREDALVNRIESDIVKQTESDTGLVRGRESEAEMLDRIRTALWHDGRKWAFTPSPSPILDPAPGPKSPSDWIRSGWALVRASLVWAVPVFPALFVALTLLQPRGGWAARLALSFIGAPILLITAAALAAGLFALALRKREQSDPAPDIRPDARALEEVLRTENATSQNILMTTSAMKPGLLRRACLRLAFWIIRTFLPLAAAPGWLGSLDDVHFARWVLLPGTGLLAFRSHYDGSWLSYLDDFVTRAPQGVTAIWSNTQGFPSTRWLVQDGARDGPRFLQWARAQTRPAPFWYSAYPHLSMSRIRLHARIVRAAATGTTGVWR